MTNAITAARVPAKHTLSKRILELDGIRGLAILLVIIWHFFGQAFQTPTGSPAAYAVASLGVSRTGVDLFFVLSGFLISGILLDTKSATSYYRTFYARRFYRILPLYGVWLASYVVGLYVERTANIRWMDGLFNNNLPLWSYAVFGQNLEMAARQAWGSSWAGITWSLAVQEQFYLLLPFVVRNLPSRTLFKVAAIAIGCAPVFRLLLYFHGNTYFGPYVLLPCRADSLGAGLLIALTLRNPSGWKFIASHRKHLYAALFPLGLGVAFLTFRHSHIVLASFGYTWLAAFYSTLLLLVVVDPGKTERQFFGSRLLVFLGTVSYGVYLFHEGLNNLLHGILFGKGAVIESGAEAWATVACLFAVLGAAHLSWRFFEAPLARRAHVKFRYQVAADPAGR